MKSLVFCLSWVLLPVLFQTSELFSESGQETDSFLGASVSKPFLKPMLGQPEQEVKRQWCHIRGRRWWNMSKTSFMVHRCGFDLNLSSPQTAGCGHGSPSCGNSWQHITSCLSGRQVMRWYFLLWLGNEINYLTMVNVKGGNFSRKVQWGKEGSVILTIKKSEYLLFFRVYLCCVVCLSSSCFSVSPIHFLNH